MKKQLCAVALLTTTALTATVQADDFTFLSGGVSINKSGIVSDQNKIIDNSSFTDKQKENMKSKNGTAGFYLNGSVGFENNVFVEGRLQNSNPLSNYLLGVGYHYPVMQQVDVYGLVGMSKRTIDFSPVIKTVFVETAQEAGIPIENDAKFPKEFLITYQDSIKPTAEIGVKARLNDLAGVQVAYRFAQFGKKIVFTEKENLHEGRIGGYYKVTDTLAIEAGYTYSSYAKSKFKDHMGQVGLRYTF